jgi:uncharacterized membrane protein
MQREWSPAARTLVGGVGSALVAYAAARRDAFGTLFALAGTALVLRAATNLEAKRITGIGAGEDENPIETAILRATRRGRRPTRLRALCEPAQPL